MSDKAEAINCVWESKNGSNQGMNRSGRTALVWSGMRRTEWQIHLRIQASFHQCDPDRSSRGQRGSGFFNADDFSSKWMLTMLFLSFPIKNEPQMRRFTVKIYLHSNEYVSITPQSPCLWWFGVAQWQKNTTDFGTLVHSIEILWTMSFDLFWKVSVFDIPAVRLHLPNRCPDVTVGDSGM